MTTLQALVLGVIQGLTEFIPVSSSGHLVFLPRFFGWEDQGLAFDVIVHLGTLVAVLFYFRNKIIEVIKGTMRRNPQSVRFSAMIVCSIIPAGIVGFFLNDIVENTLRSPVIIAYGLIGWGLVLGVADTYAKKKANTIQVEDMGWKHAALMSCAQAIALIPGTSRSGITMTAGLFGGLTKKAAAEFSFLMSVPVIALAGLIKIIELVNSSEGAFFDHTLLVGFVASVVSGFFAIRLLMSCVEKWGFMPFVVYRVVVGMLILAILV